MKKIVQNIICLSLFAVLMAGSALAAEKKQPYPGATGGAVIYRPTDLTWTETAAGWKCSYNRTGEQFIGRWVLVDNTDGGKDRWYYFNSDGIMETGWLDYEGERFYLDPDGSLLRKEGVREIDGEMYLFGASGAVWKNRSSAYKGVFYVTDENGKIQNQSENKNSQNEFAAGTMEQIEYLNAFRKEKGISLLERDQALDSIAQEVFNKAKSNGDRISLSEVYSIAVGNGYPVNHIGFIYASAARGESSSVYLTEDARELLRNLWFTRAGYYKEENDIMIIVASRPGEEASQLSADQVQGTWIQKDGHWKYRKADDTYAVSCWIFAPKNSKWYHFDENGFMQTGWFEDTNGKWYYLDEMSGEMAADTVIGGYYLGSDGAWVR